MSPDHSDEHASSEGAHLADTRVEATIEMSSVDTNLPDRGAHLLGTDFFSAQQHPLMTFRSTAIRAEGDGGYAPEARQAVSPRR